jgi:hypothetical protein
MKEDEMGVTCSMHGRGKPEGKRSLKRPRNRWEDNIRIDLREIGWEGVDWLHLAENDVDSIQGGEFLD